MQVKNNKNNNNRTLTEWELREAEISTKVALRGVEAQRLDHEVGFEAGFLQALFH